MQSHLRWLILPLLSLSCDPTTANGTAFFIRVAWQDAWGVQQLRFTGTTGSATAFPTSSRPTAPDAMLSSPQSVRVLLPDDLDGQTVNVTVAGLDGTGAIIANGTAAEQVEKGHEVSFLIELMMGGAGGGNGAGGGASSGGGTAMGGGPGGGSAGMGGGTGTGGGSVTMSCTCPGGCCKSGSSTCYAGVGIFFTCGPDAVCTHANGVGSGTCGSSDTCIDGVCDLRTTDSCGTKGCQCGSQGPCDPGMLCYGGQCFCTALTCSGCCTPDAGQCITSTSPQQCGGGGATCVACDGGTAGNVGCNNGVCSVLAATKCLDTNQCLSGDQCVDAGAPPRCIGLTGACYFCDPIISDRCHPDMNPRCGCGANAPCSNGSICVKGDAGHFCLPGTIGGN